LTLWHHSTMALNIKDPETEKLATEVAEMTGDSGGPEKPYRDMGRWLETEIWPQIPDELKGRPPMTKEEVEEILGIGPEGY
jgi:antitoxin VapB